MKIEDLRKKRIAESMARRAAMRKKAGSSISVVGSFEPGEGLRRMVERTAKLAEFRAKAFKELGLTGKEYYEAVNKMMADWENG